MAETYTRRVMVRGQEQIVKLMRKDEEIEEKREAKRLAREAARKRDATPAARPEKPAT